MRKLTLLFAGISTVISCSRIPEKESTTAQDARPVIEHLYSKSVADSFTVSISLPTDYRAREDKKYPVVYLLDGNLYFDIMATTLRKYSEVGLSPHVILVGIGYKDFSTMDSLRTRDDTYPVAIPEYEMSTSGGAPKFLSFIARELIPYIDKNYHTNSSKRVLMGHSLGGYFSTFALLRTLEGERTGIQGFIAASPSLHYNKYFLADKLKKLSLSSDTNLNLRVYVTYGGMEDSQDEPGSRGLKELTLDLSGVFDSGKHSSVQFKSDIFSNLDHMDTQLPTFIKGLQWVVADKK